MAFGQGKSQFGQLKSSAGQQLTTPKQAVATSMSQQSKVQAGSADYTAPNLMKALKKKQKGGQ